MITMALAPFRIIVLQKSLMGFHIRFPFALFCCLISLSLVYCCSIHDTKVAIGILDPKEHTRCDQKIIVVFNYLKNKKYCYAKRPDIVQMKRLKQRPH